MATKKDFIKQMFSEIVGEYDPLNRLISLYMDQSFRRRAVKRVAHLDKILDLCAGTGDMALALLQDPFFRGRVFLCDFNADMLAVAAEKLKEKNFNGRAPMVLGDVELLPFKDASMDGAILGFSLRNLEDMLAFTRECKRVVRPGGKIVLLDVAHPENPLARMVFHFYFYNFVPQISRLLTRKRYAYKYLPQSLRVFYKQKDLVEKFRQVGFSQVAYRNLLWGASAIYELTV
jgi:demethylmenaquinone methyltransferase/2-methoxy-6-polyprenyl-1,4-benzoquinol methylase